MGVIFGVFKKRKGRWADNLKGTDILFECYKWEGKKYVPFKAYFNFSFKAGIAVRKQLPFAAGDENTLPICLNLVQLGSLT